MANFNHSDPSNKAFLYVEALPRPDNRPPKAIDYSEKMRDKEIQHGTTLPAAPIKSRLPWEKQATEAARPCGSILAHLNMRALEDIAKSNMGYVLPVAWQPAMGIAHGKADERVRAYHDAIRHTAAHVASRKHSQSPAVKEQQAAILQRTSSTLEQMNVIGQEITAHLNVSRVYRSLDSHVHALFDTDALAIYLLEPDGLSLILAFGKEAGNALPFVRLALSSGTHAARCVRERRDILLDRTTYTDQPHQSPGARPTLSAMFAPLIIGDRILGAMTVQSPRPFAYSAHEQMIFKSLCTYSAIALDNAHAYRQLEVILQKLDQTQAELLNKDIELMHAKRTEEEHQSDLTRFVAVASHDMRQPMHALNLYLGALAHIDLPEPAQPVLANIRHCARVMDGMFLALLDLSRLDAKVVQPHIERFPIAPLLSRIALEFAPLAAAKGLDLRWEPCSLWVESDVKLVEQMLRNLTSNAVRYTRSGRILIGCRRRGQMLRLTVHDTGIGIAPDHQKVIFQEFFQVNSNNTHDRNKGLGLGLAIVRRLGALLALPITLVSALGRGTMFAIDLPRVNLRHDNHPGLPVAEASALTAAQST